MLSIFSSLLWIVTTFILIFSSIFLIFYYKFTPFKILKNVKPFNSNNLKILNLSLASKIGVGSISGIALSIILGGKGTLFWIWISTFLLTIITYLETKTGILYREKNNNYCIGGPYIYLKRLLKKKHISYFYLILLLFTYLFAFILIQSNSIIISISNTFNINKILIIFLMILIVYYSINNNIQRISNITSLLVPLMGLLYLLIGIYVCYKHLNELPDIIISIIKDAFKIRSIIFSPLIIGFQRAIFSNEIGMGSTSMVVALSNGNDYKQEFFYQAIGMYYISLIICTISAIIILTTNYSFIELSNINGIEIINYAFTYHFGYYGPVVSSIIITLFAFSTIITSFYYSNISYYYLFNNKNNTIIKIIAIIIIVLSGFINPSNLWAIVDISTSILTIINIYSLIKIRSYLKEDDNNDR